jgi:hypothetical protein
MVVVLRVNRTRGKQRVEVSDRSNLVDKPDGDNDIRAILIESVREIPI